MQFDPKDAESKLLPPGTYDADVFKAEDKISKSKQQPMLEVSYKVYGGAQPTFVTDYITAATAYKLKKLCAALGLDEAFQSGNVPAELLVGKRLRVEVIIQDDKTGKYDSKNVIRKYMGADEGAAPNSLVGAAVGTNEPSLEINEENIPF